MIEELEFGYWVEVNGRLEKASMGEWGKMFEDPIQRTVARSIVGGHEIETIFTGHNFRMTSPPTYYETCAKLATGKKREWFYNTREAATRGHRRIVQAVRHREDLALLEVAPR